jgi:hypothetical protein
VAATQAPLCGLFLRSPQRAGRGPQFPKVAVRLVAATQAPLCGLLPRRRDLYRLAIPGAASLQDGACVALVFISGA